ncbi:phosphate regulon transcriptional regulator PhoB [Luminiphilus sp.]|nr:phosphate regulon transcriptional regulator PhoB [Halieaceae bacterium]MDA7584608.1 phosphate regulon transcriptional regulator PhoB [Luminiphilus sp.]MDA8826729.1 phosphate regulon transcriptional regulator PhoB [Luminiphilus sp.]MDB3922869.1 phosphate regulon transcriptional regulator PhoB [Luminiphilus sp.]MDC6485587.1 phosphate regulon transcriptional regulator PhoB [Luminiphilus sp.]
MTMHKVLIVDDELAIRDMLRLALETAGYECLEAETIDTAYHQIIDDRPDIILLDWMLPGGSGIELLRRIKRAEITEDLPVIMLTAKAAEHNVIQGLDVGADDYITKPFALKELLARIKALLRRAKGSDDHNLLVVKELKIDVDSRRAFIGDQALSLGPTEFNLLLFFMSHPERAYTRSQLLDRVWGANIYVEERTVDVHIRRLRAALETPTDDYSRLIQTVRGTGYRFSEQGL